MADKRKYSDRAEYLKKAVSKRRKNIKAMAIALKGGKCQFCGYDRCAAALEFHHLDPQAKGFGLALKGLTRSWERTQKELEKCVLICSNCHKEIHAGLLQPSQVIENGNTR
jgi:5-methylcytosine-specific restriction endonuclease McrA